MQPDLHREGYGIFVRCCDLSSKVPVGEFVSTIETLDGILFGQIDRKEDFFPSPYGGAIYRRQISEALDSARALASGLSASGISAAIGVAWGRFERTVNVQDWNAAARPLNLAARLAFCDAAVGHVLVTPHVRQIANTRVEFSDERDCVVKGARFSYHLIESPDLKQCPVGSQNPETPETCETTIVLWDVVKYSTKDSDEQARLSQTLALNATTALHKFNVRHEDHSPTGDGGFALFDTGLKAIAFAKELGTYAAAWGITIRTGINHGEVALAKRGPVGPGVLRADAISALAPPNGVAILADVWGNLDVVSQSDWRPTEITQDVVTLERATAGPHLGSHALGGSMDESFLIPPAVGSGQTPELYLLPEVKFQALCRDLLDSGADPAVYSCHEYGINGQGQHGANLVANRNGGGVDVVQCKGVKHFPPAKIKAASDEFIQHLELWRSRDVRRFIVLVGSEVNNARQQAEILKQRSKFRQKYGVDYELWPSTTIINKLRAYRGIVSQHLDPGWAERLCGPNYESPLRIENTKLTAFSMDLVSALAEATDERLSNMRENWRQGRRQSARDSLAATKAESTIWNALPAKTRASFLRFESSIVLDADNDIAHADELLREAHALNPAPDDSRLNAAIRWRRGDAEGALALLDSPETDGLRHFKASLLILLRRPDAAAEVLSQVGEETAETFRLQSLCSLANRRLGEARLAIQKALEKSPLWIHIQYTAAILDYLSALAPVVIPPFLPPWPEPVHSTFLLQDDDAMERLRKAADRFKNILSRAEMDEHEFQCLEAWKVACAALDPDQRDRFEAEVGRILKSTPTQHMVLAWAVVAGFKTFTDAPAEAIRQLTIDGKAEPEQVLALAQLYVAGNHARRAATLLRRTKPLFESRDAIGVWSSWMAQVEARLGKEGQALALIATIFTSDVESRLLKARILISNKTHDSATVRAYLDECHIATGDPRFLLDFVELTAKAGEWSIAADRCEELFRQIRTAEVLRLVTFCASRAGRYTLCLKLLDDGQKLYSRSRMPSEMRSMRAHCQMELGLLPAGLKEAERLADEDPTLEHLGALTQALLTVGDFRGLCVTARKIFLMERVPSQILLRLAGQTRWEDPRLSVDLWKKAVTAGIADQDIVAALQVGFELGLDSELSELTERMAELGKSARGGVQIVSLDDLKAQVQAFHEQSAHLNAAYQNAQLPIHFLAPRFRLTLAWIYRSQFAENAQAPFLCHQPLVFVRSGRRALRPLDQVEKGSPKLLADITSILLARHFGFLETVEQTFVPILIPQSLIPSLVVMREQLTQGQVQRFASFRRIIAAEHSGKIMIVLERDPSRTDFPGLLSPQWIALAEEALRETGYLVDFLPLVTEKRRVELAEIPGDIREIVTGVKDVLGALRNCGGITSDRYDQLVNLPSVVQEPQTSLPNAGAKLFLRGTTIELFAGFDLLDTLVERFKVFVERREIRRLQDELEAHDSRQELSRWVAELVAHLNDGIMTRRYATISSESLESTDGNPSEERDPAVDCVWTLIRSHGDSTARAWIDDRFGNLHETLGKTTIIDSLEVLQQLVAHGTLSSGSYYDVVSRIRAEGGCFIPVLKDEILDHLAAVRFDNDVMTETTGLRNLRRGAAASFLAGRFLRPAMSDGQTVDPGESEFLVRSISGVSEALSELWLLPGLNENERVRKADWIVSRLFVPHHALRKLAGIQPEAQDGYTFAVATASLLTRTMSFPSGKSGRDTARQFNAWIYDRLLRRRFGVEPTLLIQTSSYLRDMIGQIWPKDLQENDAHLAALVMQQYYLCLPAPIRNCMADDPEFMAKIGVRMQVLIAVAGLQFERTGYLAAAKEAMNGRMGLAEALGNRGPTRFLPATNGEGIQLEHEDLKEPVVVEDWRHRLLADSPVRREQGLREIQELLDVPARLRDSLSEMASTEDCVRRIDKADALGEMSLHHYYAQLEKKLEGQPELSIREFLPTKLEALTRYLRLDTSANSNDFAASFGAAVRDMNESLTLPQVLDRLFRLPMDLPKELTERIRGLPTGEKQALARSLLAIPNSPLWRIQFTRMVAHCFEEEEQFVSVWNLLPPRHSDECRAYFAVVQWVLDELVMRRSILQWSDSTLLATSWAHGDRLFCLLQSYGVEASTLIDRFALSSSRISTLFEDSDPLDRDVANPHNVNREALLLCGLKEVTIEGVRLRSLVWISEEHPMMPNLDLLPDVSQAPNQMSSFLGCDRLASFIALGDEKDPATPGDLRTTFENEAIGLLMKDNNHGWAVLRAALGNGPVPVRILEDVRAALCRWDFVGFGAGDAVDTSMRILLSASTLLRAVGNDMVKARFRIQLRKMADEIHRLGTGDPHFTTGVLLEAALNLARCEVTRGERVSRFAEIISELAGAYPQLGEIAQPIVQEMCNDLPIGQTPELWRLNLRLRSR